MRARIGDVVIDVGERELHRFDLQVLRFRAVERQLADVEFLKDAERNQRRDALPVRRDLMHGVAAIVLLDRLDPIGR